MPINADGYGMTEAMISAIEDVVNAVAPGAAGVSSVGGVTGVVSLKTVNGNVLTGSGDIVVASGVNTYAGLTDKATVDLPATNTALSTALGLKVPTSRSVGGRALSSNVTLRTIGGIDLTDGGGDVPAIGGATTYASLTDKTTVDLPTVNTPLATALGALGTQLNVVGLTTKTLANSDIGKYLQEQSTSAHTLSIDTVAHSDFTWVAGKYFFLGSVNTGVITVTALTGVTIVNINAKTITQDDTPLVYQMSPTTNRWLVL